jgi:ABC-type nitrate/sulfonate/bicarbonate transport system substrate-binding protein
VGKDAGVSADQMVATPMQPPEFMAAFANHQIDGFSNSPPFVEQVLLAGTGVLVSDARLGEPTEFAPVSAALLLARGDFCAKSRTVCTKMVHGVVDALKVIQNDREQALGIMKAHFGTYDDKTLAAAYDTVKAMTPVPPVTTPKMIENGDNMNVAAGFLKPEEKLPRYDDLIDNSFAEAAMK